MDARLVVPRRFSLVVECGKVRDDFVGHAADDGQSLTDGRLLLLCEHSEGRAGYQSLQHGLAVALHAAHHRPREARARQVGIRLYVIAARAVAFRGRDVDVAAPVRQFVLHGHLREQLPAVAAQAAGHVGIRGEVFLNAHGHPVHGEAETVVHVGLGGGVECERAMVVVQAQVQVAGG